MTPRFETEPFPPSRRFIIDACEAGRKRHTIHLFAEFDITCPRALIRGYKEKTGIRLSFTGFLVACVGRAVAGDRRCHAYRKGSRLLLFDDVDIGTLVEHTVEGRPLATLHVVRAADKKTVLEIHDDIRAAQQLSPESSPNAAKWKLFLMLPAFRFAKLK